MYAEDRPTLQKILEKVEENNQMLRRLQRARRWAAVWSVLKWAAVIASAAGLYYYLQPAVDSLRQSYESLPSFSDLLETLKNLKPR